jgi:integrase
MGREVYDVVGTEPDGVERMRPAKKSRGRGLFKECKHLSWDKCECPWLGRVRGQRRVNLAKWAGVGKRALTRSEAIGVLAAMRGAILKGEFDIRGKATSPVGGRTFSDLLDSFVTDYVKRRREDGRLRSTSLDYYIERFRQEFGSYRVSALEQSPRTTENWLDSLEFTTGPKGREVSRKLSAASWNRYYEVGRRIFNWAIAQDMANVNPFLKFSKRPERNRRERRVLTEQERALFDALPQLRRKRQRTEMRRRLIAAIDLGLRQGEMLKVQVKHVDFKTWRITLPPENTKGGATTDRIESVFAMTPRVQKVLEERRFLGAEGYVFGAESGAHVASFDKSWRELFRLAG